MSYSFMSNIIVNNSIPNSPEEYYQTVGVYNGNASAETPEQGIITFNIDNIEKKAKFLMIRAGASNDFIIQLSPSNYCVHVPAGELWSVDSIDEIDKLYIRKIFSNSTSVTTGKLQWMIGYK